MWPKKHQVSLIDLQQRKALIWKGDYSYFNEQIKQTILMTWEVLQGTLRMQMHPDRTKASYFNKTAPLPLAEVGQVGKEKSTVRDG